MQKVFELLKTLKLDCVVSSDGSAASVCPALDFLTPVSVESCSVLLLMDFVRLCGFYDPVNERNKCTVWAGFLICVVLFL